jgi:hypothetical protein
MHPALVIEQLVRAGEWIGVSTRAVGNVAWEAAPLRMDSFHMTFQFVWSVKELVRGATSDATL